MPRMGGLYKAPAGETIARLLVFVFAGLFLFSNSASATPIKWILSNVTFADGGTATGFILFDWNTGELSWLISVQGGDTATFPAVTYDSRTGRLGAFGYAYLFGFRTPANNRDLTVITQSSLTPAVATIPLCITPDCPGDTQEIICNADCSATTPRIAVSGVLTSIAPVSVNPSYGAGVSQIFSALYSDSTGFADINTVMLNVNTSSTLANGCVVKYVRASNQLFLMNDAGTTWLGPATPGAAGILQNSQCALNPPSSSTSSVGNNLTVNYDLSFLYPFNGFKSVFLSVANNAGIDSGWQTLGTWTAPKKRVGQLTSQ